LLPAETLLFRPPRKNPTADTAVRLEEDDGDDDIGPRMTLVGEEPEWFTILASISEPTQAARRSSWSSTLREEQTETERRELN